MENNSTNNIYQKNRTKHTAKRLRSLIVLVSFTALLSIVEIYAWFNTQQSVSINNLQGKVEVAEGLQISLDAYNWGQTINLGSVTEQSGIIRSVTSDWTDYDDGIGSVTINSTTIQSQNIRPKVGNTAEIGFMDPLSSSGVSGNENKTIQLFSGAFSGTVLEHIRQANANEIIDESTVSNLCQAGYYAFDLYLMNTSSSNDDDTLQLTPNSIVQEVKSNSNTDYGLKNCVRVALALYEDTAEVLDDKNTIIEKTYDSAVSQVAIWEPNADTHSTYVRAQSSKMNEILSELGTGDIDQTYAICQVPETSIINDVYSTSDSSFTLQNTVKTYADNDKVINITDIDGNALVLKANKISKIRVYVWLEGQDVDCVNWATYSDGINVNIGLTKGEEINNFVGETFQRAMYNGIVDFTTITDEENGKIHEGVLGADVPEVALTYTLNSENSCDFNIGAINVDGTMEIFNENSAIISCMGTHWYVSSNATECTTNKILTSVDGDTLELNKDGTFTLDMSDGETSFGGYYLFDSSVSPSYEYEIGRNNTYEYQLIYDPETQNIYFRYEEGGVDDIVFYGANVPRKLEKYFLGSELEGRSLSEIASVNQETGNYDGFIDKKNTIADASTSIIVKGRYVENGNNRTILVFEYKSNIYKAIYDNTSLVTDGEYGVVKVYDESVTSNVGKYVSYDGKTWRIIYDDDYAGLQMICTESYEYEGGKLKLGSSDSTAEEMINLYNNVVTTLNSACESVVTPLSGKIEDVRSYGSNPYNKSLEPSEYYDSEYLQQWPTSNPGEYSGDLKIGDSNALLDFERMSMLEIGVENVWIASREVLEFHTENASEIDFAIRSNSDSYLFHMSNYSIPFWIDEDEWHKSYASKYLLPVVTLTNGALNGLSGSGTESDPYVLQ